MAATHWGGRTRPTQRGARPASYGPGWMACPPAPSGGNAPALPRRVRARSRGEGGRTCAVQNLRPLSDAPRGRFRGHTGGLRHARTVDALGHGSAYGPRGLWRRSGRRRARTGAPAPWRRAAGALTDHLGGSRNGDSRHRPGRLVPDQQENPLWVTRMAARPRQTLVTCVRCHQEIHRDRSGWREKTRHWKAG